MVHLSGRSLVAGVAGSPVRHSLSPLIHSAWIEAAGIDAAYVPFPVARDGFRRFAEGLRGGAVRGVNVTIPFKEEALALADETDAAARLAGAANLLVFRDDGGIEARNTDGLGLMGALAEVEGFDPAAGPALVLGAGGASKGAVGALIAAGAPEVRIVNRTLARAADLAAAFPQAAPFAWEDMARALAGAAVVVNATSRGLNGEDDLDLALDGLPETAVVMDMVYKPLRTGLLRAARARGLKTADGLSMLVNQAKPSFEAFFGVKVPAGVDVRALCLASLAGG